MFAPKDRGPQAVSGSRCLSNGSRDHEGQPRRKRLREDEEVVQGPEDGGTHSFSTAKDEYVGGWVGVLMLVGVISSVACWTN